MQVNVTYDGVSGDVEINLDGPVTDEQIKNVAAEVLRSGGIPGMRTDVTADTFRDYVVDRLQGNTGGERLFLRPKVPFGAGTGRKVTCYVCQGKGWTIPSVWMSTVPPEPEECRTCDGEGIVEVVRR